MRFLIIFVLLIGGLLQTNAQKIDFTHFNGLRSYAIGPAGMSGRVTAIDAINNNPNTIVIGTASGGVWQSTNAGLSWKPIFDKQALLGIGSVTIQQSNPDVIWVGTGEGNPRNSHTSGAGIYKSIDGGKTWKLMGLEKTKTIHRIIIDRDHPNTVYAAAVGSPWGENEERGVFKTIDGGTTWEKVLFVNNLTGCADLVVDPSNPNKLVAAMWEHKREPWFFNSGGEGSGMYITHDGGENWTKKTDENGLPKGNLGRMGLSFAPSNPDIIYALVESKEIAMYKSIDGGDSWSKSGTKNVGNRPFYYADIFVDPTNENRIYSLHSLITKSEDGGKSFEIIIPYTGGGVHPDHHAFWINPNNPNHIIEGNDGGLNISYDRAKTWRFIDNIPVAQFYHINVDNDFPYNVYGGMQDNGSYVGPSQVYKNGGISNYEWQEVLFGDGFDVMPDAENNRYGYAMYQGGNLYYCDLETGQKNYIQPVHPTGETLRFNWNAALAQDPHNTKGIYFGSQFLHYSKNKGKDWEIISPDLSTNDSTKQQQHKSGGLTIDATRAENHTTITAIAPSPKNKDVVWVGTDDGNLQLTKNGGESWTNLAEKLSGPNAGFWVQQIHVSKHNEGEAFIVVNDYRRNDWTPYVYHTKNFGASFKRIASEKNVSGHALSIVQDPLEPKLVFLGTENGLYISIDQGFNWNKWEKNYPSVSTMDMKIQERENDLVIGTFGRAIYVLDDIRPLRELAKEPSLTTKDFHVFDYGKAYQAAFNAATGIRFTADGYFSGANQASHAQIKVWIKSFGDPNKTPEQDQKKKKTEEPKEEKSNEKKKKPDWKNIIVRVKNDSGDTLYTYETKADTGLQVVNWYLNEKGIHYPSRKKVKKEAKDKWGSSVLPGKYNVLISYGTYSDSTIVEVLPDPRITYNSALAQKRKALNEEHNATVKMARISFERLIDLKENIERVDSYFELAEDSVKTKLKKLGATLKDSITAIQDLFMQKEGLTGYQDNSKKLNSYLYNASEHIGGVSEGNQSSATYAIEKAKKETLHIIEMINHFVDSKWKEYQTTVEQEKTKLFDSFDPLKKD